MNIYSELKQIAEINEKLKSLINELRQKDFDIDGCMFENAYFIPAINPFSV